MSLQRQHSHPYSLKTILYLICITLLLSCCLMIATIPLHECTHLLLSKCDPNLTVVGFYPFGIPQSQHTDHFSSTLGCVVVKEAYPSAFSQRPLWADLFQEIICLSFQLCIACIVTYKILHSHITTSTKINSDLMKPTHF